MKMLGVRNVIRVLVHRILKRVAFYAILGPVGRTLTGPVLRTHGPLDRPDREGETGSFNDDVLLRRADEVTKGTFTLFDHVKVELELPPDWLANPLTKVAHPRAHSHWSRIADFDARFGDIKALWELSRMGWAPLLSRAHLDHPEGGYLHSLGVLLEDWIRWNPPNRGPNWMCGQECSIRLLNVLLALKLLDRWRNPGPGMVSFIERHLRRVRLTLGYAIAQDNNHGISEAAALFVGGNWLSRVGSRLTRWSGKRMARLGRSLLEKRVRRLISRDGSFSQYSVNYHRMVLDTLSTAEEWRRTLGLAEFSTVLRHRARAAASWLYALTDPESGDAPNIGANDGARVYRLDSLGYRDFRPSVQHGAALFCGRTVYPHGPWDEPLLRWGFRAQTATRTLPARTSRIFSGGYLYCAASDSASNVVVVLKYPDYRFRPGHSDAFHIDVWFRGKPLLLDGGSYSYASDAKLYEYFRGPESHNTVQFDDRAQMPSVGRFLYADWLDLEEKCVSFEEGRCDWSATYVDYRGAKHRRSMHVEGRRVRVRDEVSGHERCAIVRWRLHQANWRRYDTTVCNGSMRLSVSSPGIVRCELVQGYESRHYLDLSEIPVLEVEVGTGVQEITTEIEVLEP